MLKHNLLVPPDASRGLARGAEERGPLGLHDPHDSRLAALKARFSAALVDAEPVLKSARLALDGAVRAVGQRGALKLDRLPKHSLHLGTDSDPIAGPPDSSMTNRRCALSTSGGLSQFSGSRAPTEGRSGTVPCPAKSTRPVMRGSMTRRSPESSSTNRRFPARPTAMIARPATRRWRLGTGGEISIGRNFERGTRTRSIRLPTIAAIPRRIVSTSGSSGM
jgi:hypothetical protein